ncbi:hypothetical protein JVT61DRAFT_14220 [Boletus reticuloceps]|uniref:Uncharacterized protein n=1 Tax=Boletus reticuloceps TaxID=495285 RepID=A0A8I2YCV2_9AGAM|nr:hypothetical protein JVT61DRAFT_14220 [Boletus reticuloceps]
MAPSLGTSSWPFLNFNLNTGTTWTPHFSRIIATRFARPHWRRLLCKADLDKYQNSYCSLPPPTAPKNLPSSHAPIRSDSGLHQPVERCVRRVQKPESDSDDFVPSSPTKRARLDPYPSGSHLHLK